MITTENKVIELVAEDLGLEESAITLESRLDELFADSLEYIAFIQRLSNFGKISDAAISKAETIGDLVNALDSAS